MTKIFGAPTKNDPKYSNDTSSDSDDDFVDDNPTLKKWGLQELIELPDKGHFPSEPEFPFEMIEDAFIEPPETVIIIEPPPVIKPPVVIPEIEVLPEIPEVPKPEMDIDIPDLGSLEIAEPEAPLTNENFIELEKIDDFLPGRPGAERELDLEFPEDLPSVPREPVLIGIDVPK